MKITPITRRDIVDAMAVEKINWSGRLEESEFLSRLYDLQALPSTDGRFKDAAGDIWQHRVNNFDWDDDWVFDDSRFQIMGGDDEVFLRFLCETIHAVLLPLPIIERAIEMMIDGSIVRFQYDHRSGEIRAS